MPERLRRICRKAGCSGLEEGRTGYCSRHAQFRRQYDQQRGSSTARGYDSTWRRIRAHQLSRQPLCEDCLEHGQVKPGVDVHHLDGNSRNNEPVNLRTLCHECHSRRTMRDQVSHERQD